MIRKAVKSSNIVSLGYDEDKEVLEVEYIRSGVYRYFNVPKKLYERALKAPSIGKFIWANIRGKYDFKN